MREQTIEIALPSDQNYFLGLIVTVYSIAVHADQNAHLSFHILDGGIEDASFVEMEASVQTVHPKSSFRRHIVSEMDFSSFPNFHGNRMTYARFVLPELLKDVDYLVYADSDCLWLADIAQLWKYRNSDVAVLAVHDEQGEIDEASWFGARKINLMSGRYFCNGLLLMNLRLFRQDKIVERSVDFLHMYPDVLYADQTAFNVVLAGRVELLPQYWNVFTKGIGVSDISRPVVLHYATQLPWKRTLWTDLIQPIHRIWFEYFDKCRIGSKLSAWETYKRLSMFAIPQTLMLFLKIKILSWPVFKLLTSLGKDNWVVSLKRSLYKPGKILEA